MIWALLLPTSTGRSSSWGTTDYIAAWPPNYFYNVVKKFIWNVRCKEGILCPAAFLRSLSFSLKVDRSLQRRFPDLWSTG